MNYPWIIFLIGLPFGFLLWAAWSHCGDVVWFTVGRPSDRVLLAADRAGRRYFVASSIIMFVSVLLSAIAFYIAISCVAGTLGEFIVRLTGRNGLDNSSRNLSHLGIWVGWGIAGCLARLYRGYVYTAVTTQRVGRTG